MTSQGMRQVNLWVPDVRSPRIVEEARRQSLLTAMTPVPEEGEFLDAYEQTMVENGEWT